MSRACVYLVGAGPGDTGLLTLKAKELLSRAEVVVYDYLAHENLLDFAPAAAKRIYVGKKGFETHITQEEIHEILKKEALRDGGKMVVRLKGGDPFVFGRGAEEALALLESNIEFEVVPGVTSGIAAAAYAGIPVTHRHCASSVAFVTGHEDPRKNSSSIQWEHLAQGVDTLCFYMGIKNLGLIARKLMEYGRPHNEPVALISWGTTVRQRKLVSQLDRVVEDQRKHDIQAPAIIVVGKVVELHDQLQWFQPEIQAQVESLPLSSKRIVVTRARAQSSKLTSLLQEQGAQVIEFPTIKILPSSQPEKLQQALSQVLQGSYDWVVFTSSNGVEAFFAELHAQQLDARALAQLKFAVVGEATAATLKGFGICADLIPERAYAEDLYKSLVDQGLNAQSRILLLRADKASPLLPQALQEQGVAFDDIEAYQTVLEDAVPASWLYEELKASSIDGICFSSSSTVHNFIELMRRVESSEANKAAVQTEGLPQACSISELLQNIPIFSIGEITTQSIVDHGLSVCIQAQKPSVESLAEAVSRHYHDQEESL